MSVKKFMINVNSKRVFELNETKMANNKTTFVKCDADGVVAGENLIKSNDALEATLDKAEAQVLDLKREIVFEQQRAETAETMSKELQIELAGIKSIDADTDFMIKDLEAEVAELKTLVAEKKAKPKKKK
jgi:hypothetical protein